MESSDAKRALIEQIRREEFGIGADTKNSLARTLHEAIGRLSAQHQIDFISELLQNADCNSYAPGTVPSLEIVLTNEDITRVGASSTLVLFNNETGFQAENIIALCGVTHSANKRAKYLGGRGLDCLRIGFKSVFRITRSPYLISNGYRIRFTDEANPEVRLGYIVPEWVEDPTITDLRWIYGKEELPQTMIVLPLRAETVDQVRQELKQISPEILLFMSTIRHLTIRDGEHSVYMKRSEIQIATDELQTVTLSMGESSDHVSEDCSYYLMRQTLQVTQKGEQRMDGVVTLAFPSVERSTSCTQRNGDLLTPIARFCDKVLSSFPFIVIADFLRVYNSFDALQVDSPWMAAILECIPTFFTSAFELLIRKMSCVEHVYRYIPCHTVPRAPQLQEVQQRILSNLRQKNVLLFDSQLYCNESSPKLELTSEGSNVFGKPATARFIDPQLREILQGATEDNPALKLKLDDLPYLIVHGCVQSCYSEVVGALGVTEMTDAEYADCLGRAQWLKSLSEDRYWKVVHFVLRRDVLFCTEGGRTDTIPIFKYMNSIEENESSLASIREGTSGMKICMFEFWRHNEWFPKWAMALKPWLDLKFMPRATVEAFKKYRSSEDRSIYSFWFASNILDMTVTSKSYVQLLWRIFPTIRDRTFILLAVEFVFQCLRSKTIELQDICSGPAASFPFVEECGRVQNKTSNSILLLPALGSKWSRIKTQLSCQRPIPMFVMSDDYIAPTSDWNLNERHIASRPAFPLEVEAFRSFLRDVFGAVDLPETAGKFWQPIQLLGRTCPDEREFQNSVDSPAHSSACHELAELLNLLMESGFARPPSAEATEQ